MQLFEHGKAYWEVARRFHLNRTAPSMLPTAVRDMVRLQQATTSQPVLRRINTFIAAHRQQPPRNSPNDDGPRYA